MCKETDWAWLAGFFEGEGHIYVGRAHSKRKGLFSLWVEISQKCPVPLVFAQELLAKADIYSTLREHGLIPTLYISARQGARTLQKLLPYMQHPEKVESARLYLKMCSLLNRQGVKLTEEQVSERENIWAEWLELREKLRGS